MKRTLLSVSICLMCTPVFSQWTSNGNIISTTQNVGIGTTAPAYKLDVNGDVRSNNVVLSPGGQLSPFLSDKFAYKEQIMGQYALGWMADSWSSGGRTLWQSGFGGIKFFTAGQFRMSIHASGYVGVGTETPACKLDVNGDVRSNNVVLSPGGLLSPFLSDKFVYKEQIMGQYALGWMVDSWGSGGRTLWQSGFGGIKFFTAGQFRMSIHASGNVGIGTETPTQKLDVNGNIRGNHLYANGTVFANEVKVEATKWSDFVFDKEYKLLPLEDVKAHIEEHKHLPDVPSEKQVLEEGINVAEMQAKLLQKIEELTLYVIQQDAKNKALEQEMKELKASFSKE
ncbi:hypothetical protein G7050_10215 [Dysgonomonas sp. HDW5A]|uniref:hypothetical protein n=1 Tax=Dysgonomonas sp. HDW5A TaxID=2714926 RepID=UPI00140B4666|nr:hypothetical protein [Dysgonomonas sp. HDW5A]QIK60183.1 hypothetical protein G7050_10215 [Dysgonomonas sp. HDW5A]